MLLTESCVSKGRKLNLACPACRRYWVETISEDEKVREAHKRLDAEHQKWCPSLLQVRQVDQMKVYLWARGRTEDGRKLMGYKFFDGHPEAVLEGNDFLMKDASDNTTMTALLNFLTRRLHDIDLGLSRDLG